MTTDPITEFKIKQRETWTLGNFGEMAVFTTPVAGHLVRYAGVKSDQTVLDVGTGTGVVAITARIIGAKVTGLDLTPALLTQVRESAAVAGHDDIAWHEGDAPDAPGALSFCPIASPRANLACIQLKAAASLAMRVCQSKVVSLNVSPQPGPDSRAAGSLCARHARTQRG